MTSTNAIDAAMKLADDAAKKQAETAPDTSKAIETVKQNQNGVQTYVPASPVSMEDVMNGPMSVDAYLKVSEHGLLIGDKKTQLIESLTVSLDLRDGQAIMPFEGYRYGKPVTYVRTYDRKTAVNGGGSWAEAVRRVQQIDPEAKSYIGVDFAVTLLEDAKDLKGVLMLEKGKTLGHSTSPTNRQAFADFMKLPEVVAAKAAGKLAKVKLGFEAKTHKDGYVWGIITFTFEGAIDA